jgi:hypothetical protein
VERLEQSMSVRVGECYLFQMLTYLTRSEDVFVLQVAQNVFYANLFAWEILDLDQTSMGAIFQCFYGLGKIHPEEHEEGDSFETLVYRHFFQTLQVTGLLCLMHHSVEMEEHDGLMAMQG